MTEINKHIQQTCNGSAVGEHSLHFRAQSTDGLAREKGAIGVSDRPEVCSSGKGAPSQVRIRDIYVCRKSE